METIEFELAKECQETEKKVKLLVDFLATDGLSELIGERQVELITKQCEALGKYHDALMDRANDMGVVVEDYREPMLNKEKVMKWAYDECMRELYEKSQPSVSYDLLCKRYQVGALTNDDNVYDRYYISHDEYKYVLDKYIDAYNYRERFTSDVDVILRDLEEGGLKNGYETDENGCGHCTAVKVRPLSELIGEENAKTVIDTINEYKNFYRFDRDEETFNAAVGFGPVPSHLFERVAEYWKKNGVELVEEKRNPDDFWELDAYGPFDVMDTEIEEV